MNYIGKTLVILNLVFALVVGGFLVVDFATRTNWRDQYFKLKDEMQVAKLTVDAEDRTLGNYSNENKRLKQERDTAVAQVADEQTKNTAQKATYEAQLREKDLRVDDVQLAMQKLLAENERFTKENQGLQMVIKQRDETIVIQQADIVKYRNKAVAEESARKNSDDRLAQALERNAEMERELVKKGTGGAGGAAGAEGTVVRGQANPPTVYVEGKIEAIHSQDTGLVQLTVGSDKGLAKNQTLEVYRLQPSPKYLGMIRIVDVTPHNAVGRLERTGTADRTPLRVGDTVASSLTRN
jgi:hypothetical protein